jgi:uncharacterized membrane protein
MAATKKTSGKASAARKGSTGKGSGSKKGSTKTRSAAGRGSAAPAEYAREAISEWRKAARFGAAALLASGGKRAAKKAADKPPLKERLNPATTEKGGRIGDAADNVLSKLGFLGKAASKMSLGSRAVGKVVPDAVSKLQPSGEGLNKLKPSGEGGIGKGSHDHPPVPIQESIDVAVPIHAAYALATRFEDYPQFSDHVVAAEEIDDTHAAFEVKAFAVSRTVEVEITEEEPEWRIEWEATEGIEHGGMLTFHELTPSLTHMELSIDIEPESTVQRLSRSIHLPERAIRADLHRFKAWAELWQEVEDIEPPEETEPEEPEAEETEPDDEEIVDEEPEPDDEFEEVPEDEFEEEPEDEYEDEPQDEYEDDEEYEEDELEEDVEPTRAR